MKLLIYIRHGLLTLVAVVAASILAVNVETFAQKKGWDLLLWDSWGPVMSTLSGLLDQGWFWASFWFVCGATAGTWLTYFLYRDKAKDNVADHSSAQTAELQYVTPIHKAVDYVALRIDDSNSGNCYLATRHALRVAAKEGAITMRGKKKLKGSSEPSALRTAIPPDFWNDQQLTLYSTEDRYRHWIHTEPETDSNNKRIGESKDQYWEILVSMHEVKKRWP